MISLFYRRTRFKKRAKAKKRRQKKFDWIAAGFLFVGVFSFYCVLFPHAAGLWGKRIDQFLGWFVGGGRFVLPVGIGFVAARALFKRENKLNLFQISVLSGLFLSGLVFLTLLSQAVWKENYGGVVGYVGRQFLSRLFGIVGAWIVAFGLIVTLTTLIFGVSPGEAIAHFWAILKNDWKDWKKAKAQPVRKPRTPVVPPAKDLVRPVEPSKPPKIMTEPVKEEPAPAPSEPVEKKETGNAPPPVTAPYQPPSMEIFEAAGGGHPVSKEELTERAALLEQTLGNFNIAARVVEIHPGPVITRYDLEPAPGVKVASIASRQDDLALAMRATGMRVLAPVPGKGAVGIEIPNTHPETVRLQALLGTPEFEHHKSPLAFALGKTVSGEPYTVDLASLPHILVAGATGSGKSVVIHSMISSILCRMPPDRVKFVLIDPKRLELPSYSLIPHLYDPCHPPASAQVITHAKQAAKALGRIVKVMEYRYDLFAKANVRNIDSYNQKMNREGKKPECFLVVIIDELADLMLSSPKEVEDSIQRLAQMARAVGIHLVLATQRPSVNVITGVIKANLPARIALRVASGTDSRVIIDSTGAESLLGKGDMLFLPPASMDPIRVQGAFVSETEVEKLVHHVKQYGLPNYDDLFSSGSALEFAVEDKKEMKDLIDALKLVLERRRVSQDLLKAHFGSSARATNILSLMEVKEFIRKPEGSNRWEINYDQIEDMLDQVGRLPETGAA